MPEQIARRGHVDDARGGVHYPEGAPMISRVSGEDCSSGSPDADFLVYRSPYPLMLMSWASGARQGACPVGRFSPAVGPHDPGW